MKSEHRTLERITFNPANGSGPVEVRAEMIDLVRLLATAYARRVTAAPANLPGAPK